MKSRFLFFSLSLLISSLTMMVRTEFDHDEIGYYASDEHGSHEIGYYASDEHGSHEHESGWMEVPGDDPEVLQAAKYAATIMSQRVNCMYPFELQEVEHANAEVTGEAVKFNMLLKLKLGTRKEKFKVKVHKNHEGDLHLHHFEQHPN